MLHMLSIVALRTTNKPPAVSNCFNQQTYATYHVRCPFLLIALLSALVRRPSGGLYIILRIREHIRAHFPNTSPRCVCVRMFVRLNYAPTFAKHTLCATDFLFAKLNTWTETENRCKWRVRQISMHFEHTQPENHSAVSTSSRPLHLSTTAGSVRCDFKIE